ncbi:DedA family protein [Alkalihalobacillus pseudalcaliphilus]|uniref:DedA family protein n=1 Tax=Alkalihalobacillus pseudalcaliphilus TaxID=79884 RepID=UPI00064DD0D7|nr:DedA family protein [Alkalihalobacillus pseudalcaliphilus]KMK76545.1 hypothetical protein AB990_15355 [Alkalihalobacillus pseudalcaliphilus]
MDLTGVYHFILEHGYAALFVIYAIGLFIFPVPNEVLLMAGGYFSTYSFLEPIPAFFTIYSAIMLHGTILYVVGFFTAHKFSPQDRLKKKDESIWAKRAEKGFELLDRYGLKAASFSYFFPFVRHAVPFSVGLAKFRFIHFLFIAHTSSLIWLSLYFLLGFYYGRTITDWNSFVEQLILTLVGLAVVVIGLYVIRERKKRKQASEVMKQKTQ